MTIKKYFMVKENDYINDYINYNRFKTRVISLNHFDLGGSNYIRLQSMTNTNTQDVDATVEQISRIVENGSDYVRVTTPTSRDVEALAEIRRRIRVHYETPLIADIHFSPKVAYAALDVADKVRINPGNLVDRSKGIDYDKKLYQKELQKIEEVFAPILQKAALKKRVIRIGTNIGSLSERILQNYGATPRGLVQATLEYIDIARKYNFNDIVVSIKASNPRLNIWANRLLVKFFAERGYDYPIHLGVTEAGNGLEGRIKSAVGIGALLVDGIGDTVRVSLTEPPENEIPVARTIVNHVLTTRGTRRLEPISNVFFNPFDYQPRKIQRSFLPDYPVVIVNVQDNYFRFEENFRPDFVFINGNKLVEAYSKDKIATVCFGENCSYKYLRTSEFNGKKDLKDLFLEIDLDWLQNKKNFSLLKKAKNTVLVFVPQSPDVLAETRYFIYLLDKAGIDLPVILKLFYNEGNPDDFAIKAAIDSGVFFIDGLVNGLFIDNTDINDKPFIARVGFEILQAANARISKAEIIACPGCGRTTFDLENVTNQIKERFENLKGIKIAVMGCIVNGLGEMADADYGYVGTGNGLVSLYKNRVLIKRNIPQEKALDELEALIKEEFNQKNI